MRCNFCHQPTGKLYIYAGNEYNHEVCRKCFMKELDFDEEDMKKYYDEENMRWREKVLSE